MSKDNLGFGYKNFAICSDDDYPHFKDPNSGAKYGGRKVSKNLSARSVIDCILETDNWDDKDVYFDIWFTSSCLISILKEHGVRATETMRAVRAVKLKTSNAELAELCKCTTREVVYLVWHGMTTVTMTGNNSF